MRDDEPERPHIDRIPTGIRGLDTVLGGGLLAGSVQLLMGRPGSGKTVLANQMAFHRATAGHTAAYVTLLAESHARMLAHLGPFSFFDPSLVSRRILYMSGYSVLDQGGLDGLLELLTRTIREHAASLLVIDSLSTAKEFAPTTNAFKRFLLSLTTSASLTGCTMLLISNVDRVSEAQPENATVDGIIALDKRAHGARVARELTIEKMRGTKYALGLHAIDISQQGIDVYPRLESLPLDPFAQCVDTKRHEFGIAGLDAMLGGGVLTGSATAIIGATGTGKTMLGMSFLRSGVAHDETGVYVSMREAPSQVLYQAERIGLRLREPVAREKIALLWLATTEMDIDILAWQVLDLVDHVSARRVFIDGFEGFGPMISYPDRLKRFYTALIAKLAVRRTAIVMAEASPTTRPAEETLSLMSPNNVIMLSETTKGRRTHRLITTLKVQGTHHELGPHRLRITSKGLSVDTPWLLKARRSKP